MANHYNFMRLRSGPPHAGDMNSGDPAGNMPFKQRRSGGA